jgi:hypothetical protein
MFIDVQYVDTRTLPATSSSSGGTGSGGGSARESVKKNSTPEAELEVQRCMILTIIFLSVVCSSALVYVDAYTGSGAKSVCQAPHAAGIYHARLGSIEPRRVPHLSFIAAPSRVVPNRAHRDRGTRLLLVAILLPENEGIERPCDDSHDSVFELLVPECD